jgi:hypothetical protein
MGYGIGGGGFMGVAIERLTPPVQIASTTNTSGGTLGAGTWRAVITAINGAGETTVSNEISQVTTGATSTINWNWNAVNGATGYKVYRTALGGAPGTELLLATVGAVTTYLDTAPGAPAGAQPAANTALAPNIYTAPTKYFPLLTTTLNHMQDTQWRRPIRQNVDILGAVPGNTHTEGDVEMEALMEPAVYFHLATRAACIKSGAGPFIYTFTPTSVATPIFTLSITVIKNGVVFGYVGCIVGSFKYVTDNGQLKATYSITGSDEAVQSMPTPTFTGGQQQPFGAGEYNIQIPTATQVFDADTLEFNVNDSPDPQYRLKDTGRGAQFIKLGERSVTLTTERDFQTRAEYDAYKALTAQSITLKATKDANTSWQTTIPAGIKDKTEVNLGGQGDLTRMSISYNGTYDAGAAASYSLVLKSADSIPVT